MNGELIHQMGLLLTQMRYVRRSLEDIERSTARYASFTFAGALTAGPKWGEPPMFGGALKVWVVNINDLAPSGPGLLEGLLGGVGRLFGGLLGGFVGGTIAGVALPVMIGQVLVLAGRVERIIDKLGLAKTPAAAVEKDAAKAASGSGSKPEANQAIAKAAAGKAEAAAKQAAPPTDNSTVETLESTTSTVNAFTALFQAASGDTKAAADTSNPMTPAAARWLEILRTADSLIRGITLLVKGLTLLLPEVIGTIALLIARLDSIKLAVAELLQFILREALLLRGVALTILFDTLATAARLAANMLGILGLTLQEILVSAFKMFTSVFDAALAAIQFLSTGLAQTIDALLKWLVSTIVTALQVLGATPVFRIVVYAIQTLPYILPPLVLLIRDKDIDPRDRDALETAKKRGVLDPVGPGPSTVQTLPAFPDVAATLLDPKAIGTLNGTIQKSLDGINNNLGAIFNDSASGLRKMDLSLERAAGDQVFNEALDKHIGKLGGRVDNLVGTLGLPAPAKKGPATGLDLIAQAYETWLSSPNGLQALLGNITSFIRESPTTGPQAEKGVGAAIVALPTAIDRPRATVEIDDLVIELMPLPEKTETQGVSGLLQVGGQHMTEQLLTKIVELVHEMDQRGMTFGPGTMVCQV